MLYQDLLQAKKEGRWVATPDGVGQLNGIGLASSPVLSPVEGYVAFPDPHPDISFRLLLFGNEDIQEVDAEWYCDDCGKPLLVGDQLVIVSPVLSPVEGLGVITEDGCIEDPIRPPVLSPVEGFEVYCPECAPKPTLRRSLS